MLDIIKEFFLYLKEHKKLWLTPLIIILILFGLLVILGQGSTFAPFIYTVF